MRRGRLFIVSGPSGVGKDTVLQGVYAILPGVRQSVSATTREPREGEVDGVDYTFLSEDAFSEHIQNDAFLEWKRYSTHRYGTLRAPVDAWCEQGLDVVLKIEVKGALDVRSRRPDSVLIFIAPPRLSLDTLRERLERRGSDDPESVARRLDIARWEMEHIRLYDYVIENDVLDDAVDALRSIIVAERHRPDAIWGSRNGVETS